MSEETATAVETAEVTTETTTQETPSVEQVVTTENTEPSAEVKPEKTFTQAELDQIIQKRLEREQKKYQQEYGSHPGLSFLQERASSFGMTVEQFIEGVRRQDEEARINQLVDSQNIDPELAKEILENRKFREQYEQEKRANETQRQREQRINADISKFQSLYPDVKEVPEEVWKEVDEGSTLVDAYARHENRTLKDEISKLKETLQIRENNAKNAATSPGSMTGQGGTEGEFITRDAFEANKSNRQWVVKNLSAITKSRAKW